EAGGDPGAAERVARGGLLEAGEHDALEARVERAVGEAGVLAAEDRGGAAAAPEGEARGAQGEAVGGEAGARVRVARGGVEPDGGRAANPTATRGLDVGGREGRADRREREGSPEDS